jgi:hypothetical protein
VSSASSWTRFSAPRGRELTHLEAGYFVVGMKSYGRAPTFPLATGYEQVRSVVAPPAGPCAAASEPVDSAVR